MKTDNVSEPIFSSSMGWFRYNYDQGRLEFLNHETKLVVQIWTIPADQWEALPSQRDYCENIVRQSSQQAQNQAKSKQGALFGFMFSLIPTAIYLIKVIKNYSFAYTTPGIILLIVATLAIVAGGLTLDKYNN